MSTTETTSGGEPALGPLLTPAQAAEVLGVPARTLERWRTERRGPRFARLGRHVRYRHADVTRFLDEAFAAWDDWQAS